MKLQSPRLNLQRHSDTVLAYAGMTCSVHGLHSDGLHSYGLYSHGLYSHDLWSYGMHSYGPYNSG